MKLLLFIVLISSFTFSQNRNSVKSEKTILTLSGSGMQSTETFSLTSSSEIKYFNGMEDMAFSIYLMKPDGTLGQVLVSTARYGEGKTHCHKIGTYYLTISGMGDWSVKIVQK